MLDEMKLFEQVNKMIDTKNGVLNEDYIPFGGRVEVRLFIRSKYGGGGRNGNASSHDCTVKIIIKINEFKKSNIEFPVPVYSYTDIPVKRLHDMYDTATTKLEDTTNSIIANSVLSFIYDNQMWLRALWERKDAERGRVGSVIYNYLEREIRSTKYIGATLEPKSMKELEEDQKEITKYVRKQLKDDSIQLDFGSVKEDDKKRKKKR